MGPANHAATVLGVVFAPPGGAGGGVTVVGVATITGWDDVDRDP